MKFVAAYSCGKDSALAVHHFIQEGNTLVGLVVTVNQELSRSWFHGVDMPLLKEIAQSIGAPLIPCVCMGEEYNDSFDAGLKKAKQDYGAECCVFGDIDMQGHLDWDKERCDAAGLKCVVPLWQQNREALVREVIDLGFCARIKCVQNKFFGPGILGRVLDAETLELIRSSGADSCGENGEYHTLVTDGPIFSRPVLTQTLEILNFGSHSAINIIFDQS